MKARLDRSDRGDTLIEVLLAVVVLGITAAALLGGFAMSISAAGEHRALASLSSAMTTYQDNLRTNIESSTTTGFVACATPSDYQALAVAPPSGFSATVTSVTYWSGTSWSTSCSTATNPPAPELVTISVSNSTSTLTSSFGVSDPRYLPGSGA